MQQRDSPARSDIYLLCIGLGLGPAGGLSPGSHEDISMLVMEYTGTFAPPQHARKPSNVGTILPECLEKERTTSGKQKKAFKTIGPFGLAPLHVCYTQLWYDANNI